MTWSPSSWRQRPAAQLPTYEDRFALVRTETRLSEAAPLTRLADIERLGMLLAEVAKGKAFLLQGGDCAESFAEFGANKVRTMYNLLLQMGAMLNATGQRQVVTVARIAGQFAKPRSSGVETQGDVTLPSYRGDIINGAAFDPTSRRPDPERMLHAYRQAGVTMDLLRAYSAAAYADLGEIRLSASRRLGEVGELSTAGPESEPGRIFTSHEALLLHYEQALTRWDPQLGRWWATSADMLWIGDRTRQLDGAHVEYVRGIANPIGIKCGPSLPADELLRLIDRIDPDNQPGRLVLIGRFGARAVAEHLPRLMQATQASGSHAVWTIDPMHGNTTTAGGFKTRFLPAILEEVRTFFDIARAEDVHPGGIHLEMTGEDVTECLGGSLPLVEADLPRRYATHCDPRLNQHQALDVMAEVAQLTRPRSAPLISHAA